MRELWGNFQSSVELTERIRNEQLARKYATEKRGISEMVCREQSVSFVSRGGKAAVRFEVISHRGNCIGGVLRYVEEGKGPKMQNEPGTPQIISHLHKIKAEVPYVIWTEGAFDRLSFLEAGLENVLTCPGFALGQKELPRYLQTREVQNVLLSHRSVIATDNDAVGNELAGHLARVASAAVRLRFPTGIKDANEYLVRYGKQELYQLTMNALAQDRGDLSACFEPDTPDVLLRAEKLWQRGASPGYSTGNLELDRLWMWMPGVLAICSGYAGSGKSTFLDWLLTKAYETHRWSTVFVSFETTPELHSLRLAALHADLPIFEKDRPEWKVVKRAMEDLHGHFKFIDYTEIEETPSLTHVMAKVEAAVKALGAKVAVIDPWNAIAPDQYSSEHQWIARSLTQLRQMAMRLDIVMIVVAHPTKPRLWQGKKISTPTGHDVSGSAAWTTKADIGFSVHRRKEQTVAEVSCWKLRNDYLASVKPAMTRMEMDYDVRTGHYLARQPEVSLEELEEFLNESNS